MVHPAELAEEYGEHQHRHGRLQHSPADPSHGLLVADLDVPHGKQEQQVAEAPYLADVDGAQAAARLYYTHGSRGFGYGELLTERDRSVGIHNVCVDHTT